MATAVYEVTGSWNPATVTYATRPAVATTAIASAIVTDTVGRWYEWNLTSWLQQQKAAGKKTVSLELRNPSNTSPYTIFTSRKGRREHAATGDRPLGPRI